MPRDTLVPEVFGALRGVRILSTGSIIAQPFAASLAAQMGAEVIQVERPGVGDAVWREVGLRIPTKDGEGPAVSTSWLAERRNAFHVTLDMSVPAGREIFLELAERAEIWMESSRPGTYSKWDLTDKVVLDRNPKLVICHVSGYGQTGDPGLPGAGELRHDRAGLRGHDVPDRVLRSRTPRARHPVDRRLHHGASSV